MPPVHPAFVHFPIALVVFSVAADWLATARDSSSLRHAAWWALVFAALIAVLTVLTGLYDMGRVNADEVHGYINTHRITGYVLLGAIWALATWRWFIRARPSSKPGWGYLASALLVVGLAAFQGWFGGEMVYSHGIGVAQAGRGTEPAEQAQQRLKPVQKALGGEVEGGGHGEAGDAHGEADKEATSH